MSLTVALLYYSTLLLPSLGFDLKYRSVEESQQSVEATVDRFTRAETQSNVSIERDTHVYYRSTYYPPSHHNTDNLWLDLASMVDSGAATVDNSTTVSALSGVHRFFEVHELKFKFPFYGHTLESVLVTTGGFLYTGDLIHERLQLTQYIAPLQADFNPSYTDTGRVLVLNTEERFTVQWDKVHNHVHLNDGPFTFQVSIFPNGDIHFVYQEVPLLLDDIEGHPVEVGVADAFYIFDNISALTTMFEYDRVSLDNANNLTNSAYILSPLLNCVSATSCEQCAIISDITEFQCGWCDEIQRCSDGIDRYRQDWLTSGCSDTQQFVCPTLTDSATFSTPLPTTKSPFGATTSATPLLTTKYSFATAPATRLPTTKSPFAATSSVTPHLTTKSSFAVTNAVTLLSTTSVTTVLTTSSFTSTTPSVANLPLATSNLPQRHPTTKSPFGATTTATPLLTTKSSFAVTNAVTLLSTTSVTTVLTTSSFTSTTPSVANIPLATSNLPQRHPTTKSPFGATTTATPLLTTKSSFAVTNVVTLLSTTSVTTVLTTSSFTSTTPSVANLPLATSNLPQNTGSPSSSSTFPALAIAAVAIMVVLIASLLVLGLALGLYAYCKQT